MRFFFFLPISLLRFEAREESRETLLFNFLKGEGQKTVDTCNQSIDQEIVKEITQQFKEFLPHPSDLYPETLLIRVKEFVFWVSR